MRYYNFNEPLDATEYTIHEDFLNSLTPAGFPPHELLLKPNDPIILLQNINPTKGLCKGTHLICRRFNQNIIDAEISFGHHCGKQVILPRNPSYLLKRRNTSSHSKEPNPQFVYISQ